MEGEQSVDLIRVQLRKQRALAGMNQEEFGKRTNYSASTVSAVETGTRPIDLPYARRADEILETGGLFESLLRTAQQDAQPAWFMPWLKAERAAKQLRCFHPTLIPGLLQTENYARAVLRFDDTRPEQEIEQQVAARMERQEILKRERPPQIVAVTDEAALRRTDAIMAEQLAHLLRVAELPHVHIHIIPSRAGLHVGLSGPVLLARLSDGTWVGHLESQLGGEAADTEDRLSTLLARWECVRGVALPEDLSVALIKEVESQHGPQ
ncbi:helix-turn-helix transcriptional regulator [Micromonospora gifhornensis]|uniref:Transcriptional regulator n=1 Tax=Micromonospora gifhornensis TaxID=84594 RepID=A0ABQ4IE29_9ACTN|nr:MULTISPECIES: helix-turn-helix transcriptional regulator [Micromonospora]PMR61177.1 DNA-binding protein [Verrucosispora sp. ts21]GIJ16170.1 transcriptional regulator [Micromonospora gifhornensis]